MGFEEVQKLAVAVITQVGNARPSRQVDHQLLGRAIAQEPGQGGIGFQKHPSGRHLKNPLHRIGKQFAVAFLNSLLLEHGSHGMQRLGQHLGPVGIMIADV